MTPLAVDEDDQVATGEQARPPRAVASWLALHSVDLAFALVIGITFAYLVRITSDGYFFLDDWGLIERAGSVDGLLQPYNSHLSVTILVIYRALVEAFGFAYGPFRTVGMLGLLAVPVSFYLTTRRSLGPPLAALAALAMLGFTNLALRPATLNHYLMVIGGIGCAAALNRGRRADWALALMLGLSLSAAGGGIAVAIACVLHNACVRPRLRRWVAVGAPLALWGTWLLIAGGGDEDPIAPRAGHSHALASAREVAWTPFQHLGFDNTVLATTLLIAFVAYGLWRLRQGLDAASNFVAWSAAVAVWSLGLGYARGRATLINEYFQNGDIVYRYQLIALVFALLALVPRRPITWPKQLPIATNPRWLTASAGLLLLMAWLGSVAIRSHVDARADAFERKAWEMRSVVVELQRGDERRFPLPELAFFDLRAEEVLSLLDRYGQPPQGPLPLPTAPTILDVAAGDERATVSWTAPTSDGGSAIIGYRVTPYLGFAPQAPQIFESQARTQILTDLINGETYRFMVQAVNEVGASGFSEISAPVTPTGS